MNYQEIFKFFSDLEGVYTVLNPVDNKFSFFAMGSKCYLVLSPNCKLELIYGVSEDTSSHFPAGEFFPKDAEELSVLAISTILNPQKPFVKID